MAVECEGADEPSDADETELREAVLSLRAIIDAEERGVGAPPLTITGAGAVGGRTMVTGVGRVLALSGRGPRYVALRVTRGASAFGVVTGATGVVTGSVPGVVVLRVN